MSRNLPVCHSTLGCVVVGLIKGMDLTGRGSGSWRLSRRGRYRGGSSGLVMVVALVVVGVVALGV